VVVAGWVMGSTVPLGALVFLIRQWRQGRSDRSMSKLAAGSARLLPTEGWSVSPRGR
jgi:hypothetical protein